MDKDFKLHPIDYSPYFAPAAAVETFMKAAGHLPVSEEAYKRQFDLDTVRLYFKFVKEEFKELSDAFDLYDAALADSGVSHKKMLEAVAEILDGGHDLVWVTLGMLLATGFPIQAGWSEVANSNLAKIDRATKMLHKREDGKVLKPEGWKPPDFLKLMDAHFAQRIKS